MLDLFGNHLVGFPTRRLICIIGAVYSWGDGDYGKLGRGGSDGCKAPKVIERLMGQDVIKVYCGAQFSLALTKSGAVFSW